MRGALAGPILFSWIVNRSILIVGTYGADCEPAASEEVVVNFLSVLREGKKVWAERDIGNER